MKFIKKVLQGNCLEILDDFYNKNGEYFDFIYADPPYFYQMAV